MTTPTEFPLVPPARLAGLLVARRRELELDLAAVSHRAGGRFSPSHLEEIERGRVNLDERALQEVIAIYELDAGPVVPERSKLVLDLHAGHVRVGTSGLAFDTATTDVILERYVSLLYLLRHEKPGKKLVLRADDLDVLGSTLHWSTQNLKDELFAIMASTGTSERTAKLRSRLSIGAAGLLVGVTAAGTLVLLGSASAGAMTTTVDASPVSTGDTPVLVQATVLGDADGGGSGLVSVSGQSLKHSMASEMDDAPDASLDLVAGNDVEADDNLDPDPDPDPEPEDSDPEPDEDAGDTDSSTPEPEPEPEDTDPEPEPEPEDTDPEDTDPIPDSGADAPVDTINEEAPSNGQPTIEELASARTAAPSNGITPDALEAHLNMNFDALIPGWTIKVEGPRHGYKGLTNSHERTISVFVGDGDTLNSTAEILAHEIGHAVDVDLLDSKTRVEWAKLRSIDGPTWWATSGASDFSVGAGDFAEAVSAYLSGSASASDYGGFTADQMAFVGRILANR